MTGGRDEAYQLQWDSYRGQQKQIIKLSERPGAHSSQIGLQHGRAAKIEIEQGLRFYETLFQKTANLSWSQACDTAAKFELLLSKDWPDYCTEMKGRADCHKLLCIIIWVCIYLCNWKSQNSAVYCSSSSAYDSAFPHCIIPRMVLKSIRSQNLKKVIYDSCFHSFHQAEPLIPSLI